MILVFCAVQIPVSVATTVGLKGHNTQHSGHMGQHFSN